MDLIVGVVAGPHGLKGHVKLIVRTDDPAARFAPGVLLDTDREEPATLVVEEARQHGGSWQLRFAGVADRNAAEALRGIRLSIDTAEWDKAEGEWYDAELVGLTARTPAGAALGSVVAVEHRPAQDLLVVETPSGGRVRVPFVAALVPHVGGGEVVIDPPGGLFELEG